MGLLREPGSSGTLGLQHRESVLFQHLGSVLADIQRWEGQPSLFNIHLPGNYAGVLDILWLQFVFMKIPVCSWLMVAQLTIFFPFPGGFKLSLAGLRAPGLRCCWNQATFWMMKSGSQLFFPGKPSFILKPLSPQYPQS